MEGGEISATATTSTTTGCSSLSAMTGAKASNSEHSADISKSSVLVLRVPVRAAREFQEGFNFNDYRSAGDLEVRIKPSATFYLNSNSRERKRGSLWSERQW
jgi:hypothetical protein